MSGLGICNFDRVGDHLLQLVFDVSVAQVLAFEASVGIDWESGRDGGGAEQL